MCAETASNHSWFLCSMLPQYIPLCVGRRPSVEDDLQWKMTFGGRRSLVEDNLQWKMTFVGSLPAAYSVFRHFYFSDGVWRNIYNFKNKYSHEFSFQPLSLNSLPIFKIGFQLAKSRMHPPGCWKYSLINYGLKRLWSLYNEGRNQNSISQTL